MEDIYISPPQPVPTTLLAHLYPQHLRMITTVVSGILATERGEDAFAQLVDGIPTRSTFEEHFQRPPLLDSVRAHEKPTEDALKLVRTFRQQLDISSLHLDSKIVQAYQNASLGSWQFQLRFLELVATTLNALAGMIYSISHPNTILHPHDTRMLQPPHYTLDFYHGAYMLYQKYPYGVLNMIGYWMETRIFGGVLLVEHDDLEFSRIHPYWPTFTGCVGRMTDEDREIRDRFGSRALAANLQRRNQDDPNNPDSSNT